MRPLLLSLRLLATPARASRASLCSSAEGFVPRAAEITKRLQKKQHPTIGDINRVCSLVSSAEEARSAAKLVARTSFLFARPRSDTASALINACLRAGAVDEAGAVVLGSAGLRLDVLPTVTGRVASAAQADGNEQLVEALAAWSKGKGGQYLETMQAMSSERQ